MTSLMKPCSKRAERITAEEHDCHHWLGRLAMCLAIMSHELEDGAMKRHVRNTIDEFVASDCSSAALVAAVCEETNR